MNSTHGIGDGETPINCCPGSVQRTRPFGGWLWDKVVRIVSILSSILGSRPARGNSFSTKSINQAQNIHLASRMLFPYKKAKNSVSRKPKMPPHRFNWRVGLPFHKEKYTPDSIKKPHSQVLQATTSMLVAGSTGVIVNMISTLSLIHSWMNVPPLSNSSSTGFQPPARSSSS